MDKDKHIISELNAFFHENDCNKAINCIMTTIRHLNQRLLTSVLKKAITASWLVFKSWNCCFPSAVFISPLKNRV